MSMTTEKAFVHSVDNRHVDRPDGTSIQVAVLRCLIDRSYRSGENEDGSPRYVRDKSFWANVEVWGRRVRFLHDTVREGAAVLVTGRYFVRTWEDDAGNKRESTIIRATDIAILPWCIASVEYRSRDEQQQEPEAGSADEFYGDVPF